MTKKASSKIKDLIVKEVEFNGDKLWAVQDKSTDKIYVGVKWVCEGLMFEETQSKAQVEKIRDDIVLQQGSRKFPTQVKSSNGVVQEREILCIELEFLPLWLAKINITPRMQENSPDIVNKLIDYQLHAKNILANYFLNSKKVQEEWNLTREVGKKIRRKLTDTIQKNIKDANGSTYADYTDMTYIMLFGKRAAILKQERNCKDNTALRDTFTKQELELVDESEGIVLALISLGCTKQEIAKQLKNKFGNVKLLN